MRTFYGQEIIENCLACPQREERLFCNLSDAAVKALANIASSAIYPKGATLFVHGQPALGVFILCSGRVKLSTSSADGRRTLILRLAEPGEVLGLPGTVTGSCYELTANVIERAQANFIARSEFLAFLEDHGEAALRVAQQLGETYHSAISELRTIGLSHSVGEKLVRFLLEWAAKHPEENGQEGIKITLTHEEIAEMISASRETVTRLLSDFRKNQILEVTGSTLVIKNKQRLESFINYWPFYRPH
jgi:CRP/FNR family transcriptional regulator